MKKTVIENNRLIAEFMKSDWNINGSGFNYIGSFIDPVNYEKHQQKYGSYYYPEDMEYNTSWDWIMPVVIKIQSITTFTIRLCNSEMNEIYTECTTFKHGYLLEDKDPITAVYNKCVNFINAYNFDTELNQIINEFK